MELLITSGDPGGIGPELVLQSLQHLSVISSIDRNLYPLQKSLYEKTCNVTVLSSKVVLQFLIDKYELPLKIVDDYIFNKQNPNIRFFLVDIPITPPSPPYFGVVCSQFGAASWKYIQKSIQIGKMYLQKGKNFCIFNLPVCKQSIQKVQNSFLGHTEEYAKAFGVKSYAMSFLSSTSSLVLMTTHIPLSQVSSKITTKVIKNAFFQAKFLQTITKDTLPLLVLGLNPHAGEGGILGKEEKLINRVRREVAFDAVGPVSPDIGFLKVLDGSHKTVIACYHDQGLIPMKLLNRFESCNYTVGLPFIRTSVDHGTAFDIAGKMQCDVRSTLYCLAKTYQLSLDFSKSSNKE